MTRNPRNIDAFLLELGWHWKRLPDLRFCELVDNVAELYPFETFHLIEDDVFMDMLRSYHEQVEPEETSVSGTD